MIDDAIDAEEDDLGRQWQKYFEAGCDESLLRFKAGHTPTRWHLRKMNYDARFYNDELDPVPRAAFVFRATVKRIEGYVNDDDDGITTSLPPLRFEEQKPFGKLITEDWMREASIPITQVSLVASFGRLLSEGEVPFVKKSATRASPGDGNGSRGTTDSAIVPNSSPTPENATTAP
jgi:hypothetical protein